MLRKARIADAKKIQTLIGFWTKKGRVLNRPLNYIFEHIRDFWVYEEKRAIIGACALHVVGWDDLAEVKSLVVRQGKHRHGIGRKLVGACIAEAKELGVKNLFALTYVDEFFKKLGFKKINKDKLPIRYGANVFIVLIFPTGAGKQRLY